MEKLNLDFSDKFNIIQSILWILSILSWLFFICTGFASIKIFHIKHYEVIWTIQKIGKKINGIYTVENYYPLQINTIVLYIIFIFTLILAVIAFVVYIIKSTCLKEDNIYEGMMGIWSRLNSFPLIIVSFLFLLGEYFYPKYYDIYYYKEKELNIQDYAKYFNRRKEMSIFGLAFSLIALISLIFIYIMTDLKTDKWYIVLATKKGFYSCLIILLWYYFFYAIFQLNNEFIYYDLLFTTEQKFKNTLSIGFSIIIGGGSLLFSFFFKDLFAAFMNILIYIGMTIYFFHIEKSVRELYGNLYYTGIINSIVIALSVADIIFLLSKYRKECLRCSKEEF